jgi:hypothetical protein
MRPKVSFGLNEVFIKRTIKLPSPGERNSLGLPFVNHSKTSNLKSRSLLIFSPVNAVGNSGIIVCGAGVEAL